MKKENKLIKNILVIILIYVVLMFANNFREIFSMLFNSNNDNSFEFINISILISTILMILLFIFRKYIFKNKLNLWIIFCTLILYNFAEGYFLDFYAFPFIILYVYIILLTYFTILLSKQKFEISIVTSFSILLLSAFVIGMFGLLKIFKFVMLLSVILIIIYIYTVYKNDKIRLIEAKDKLFDNGFIVFNILWIIAILSGAGMYVHTWDEYSHWAYDAKATIYYSKFGASQEIMSKSKGYAPIFTMWHYIVAIFNGFSEHNLYVALSMLISIYLMPTFYWLKNNGVITKILAFISIAFCCYLFGGVYSYNNLYADYAITSIFASIIILYSISQDDKINLSLSMILCTIIITLSKTNGFVIAFVALLIIFFNELFKERKLSFRNIIGFMKLYIRKYWKLIFAVIITFMIWKLYLIIMGKITTEYYDFVLLPESLKSDLKYKLNYEFIASFIKKVFNSFDDTLISGIIDISLYQFLIIVFTSIFLIFYINNKKDIKCSLKMTISYIIGYLAFFILTVVSIFVAMTQYEASILASFSRYLNWFNLGIVIFILYNILKFGNKNKLSVVPFILLLIVISIPLSDVFSFVVSPIRGDSYNTYLEKNEKMQILKDNVPDDSMVYVIDQKDVDGIMAMWYTRYYAFPRKVNASSASINWKIKTSKNKDDLQDWGLTAEEWAKHIVDYKFDYVYLYTSDEEFYNETEFLYDDIEKAKKSSLFKILVDGGITKLVPIK